MILIICGFCIIFPGSWHDSGAISVIKWFSEKTRKYSHFNSWFCSSYLKCHVKSLLKLHTRTIVFLAALYERILHYNTGYINNWPTNYLWS